jgi:universal stress protein E
VKRPRHILAAIPPTKLAPTVAARAFAVARRLGANVQMVASVYDPYVAGERFSDSPELEAARGALVARRHADLEALANRSEAEGVQVSVHARWHYPVVDGLLAAVADAGPDLLIAGTFHHSPLQRLGLGNMDWQLIRRAPCPLLLVRADGFSGYEQILAAVDPLHEHDKPAALDGELLATARLMAEVWDGRVHVLHCYLSGEYVPFVAPGASLPPPFDGEPPEEVHRQALQKLVAAQGLKASQVLLEAGDPRQRIPETAARLGVNLVVMGAVARSRIGRWMIGSTAESVLDRLDCDVLIIKPSDLSG